MFMRHHSLRKGFNAGEVMGTARNAFQQNGLNVVASSGDFLLGDNGQALVLCHVMPISNEECHVITVSASENQQATGVTESVSSVIERTVHFD
jgi:hypothetical protein